MDQRRTPTTALHAPEGPPPPAATMEEGRYRIRFARTTEDLDAVLRLRYEVFNVELGEGLETSHETGRDRDPFDTACHHLMVEDLGTDHVVGTYRMQTRSMAERGIGFYSAGEFDLGKLPSPVLDRSMEIGRACIAEGHRNHQVLFLLWKGLALYVAEHRKRYLFGCCSLTGTDPREGLRVYRYLRENDHMHAALRVEPLSDLVCRVDGPEPAAAGPAEIPKLFRTYLRYGAKACGPPAIDRQFNTIDFFVIFDVDAMDRDLFRLYF